jgi:alpha-glucosidase
MVSDFKEKNIRVMTYINPMMTDVTNKKNHSKDILLIITERNFFNEAKEKNYLIHRGDKLFTTKAFSDFSAGLLDLTNPEAVSWYKNIIKHNVLN